MWSKQSERQITWVPTYIFACSEVSLGGLAVEAMLVSGRHPHKATVELTGLKYGADGVPMGPSKDGPDELDWPICSFKIHACHLVRWNVSRSILTAEARSAETSSSIYRICKCHKTLSQRRLLLQEQGRAVWAHKAVTSIDRHQLKPFLATCLFIIHRSQRLQALFLPDSRLSVIQHVHFLGVSGPEQQHGTCKSISDSETRALNFYPGFRTLPKSKPYLNAYHHGNGRYQRR